MYSTRVSTYVNAPPAEVYRLLLDGSSIVKWRVPDGMTGKVHEYDAREGGRFRISLTYTSADQHGKSAAHTDTYSTRLAPTGSGTEVTIEHEGIPDAVSPADNEAGTRMALAKLQDLAERSAP